MTAPFRPDLRQPRRDPAQGPPESARKFAPAEKERKTLWAWGVTGAKSNEVVLGMGGVGRVGSHGRDRKRARRGSTRLGAISKRRVAGRPRLPILEALSGRCPPGTPAP